VSESAGVTALRCDVCGYEYPNPAQAGAEPQGTPCPNPGGCATTGRQFDIAVSDSIQIHDALGYTIRDYMAVHHLWAAQR
jgi:hypothetical protein